MKRLTVLRHAKSRWDDLVIGDFNRPLNERGWLAAKRIGRELRKRDFHFDFVLASPAARVRETIDGVENKFSFNAPIKFEQRMYLAAEELLLSLVRDFPESVRHPLLVGHNPGLQSLLLDLSKNDDEGLRDRVADKFPTAALAVLDLPAQRWTEVEPKSGWIKELVLDKDL
ncbi:MAG TPA: histidine phosphatase family protein [Sphingomicrobium sp.]|nr:histidine phosphatase family protein [Sphingomicrobium sp.]